MIVIKKKDNKEKEEVFSEQIKCCDNPRCIEKLSGYLSNKEVAVRVIGRGTKAGSCGFCHTSTICNLVSISSLKL